MLRSDPLFIGIDVGSVSVNLVVLSSREPTFGNKGKEVLKEYYVRIEGESLLKTYETLKDALSLYPTEKIEGMAVTGSGGKLISKILNIPFINEIITQSKSTGFLHPEVRTVIEIGGEDSKFILLEFDKKLGIHIIKDFSMNTICAAGTGSFLDHQASRMGYTIQEFGEVALKSEVPPRIAGRCSVFAKTDMIHLQQEASPDYDIIAGLCFALARNFKSAIAKNKEFDKPISFQGGVAANRGLSRAFREVLELKDQELIIPRYFASMGAIGAALTIMEKPNLITSCNDINALMNYHHTHKDESVRLEPLGNNREQGKTEVKPFSQPRTNNSRPDTLVSEVYLGIDVGSVSTNVVAIDDKKNVISRKYLLTAGRPIDAVRKGIEEVGSEIKDSVVVRGAGTTGSGRYMIGDLIGADVIKNEITAQARASIEVDKDVDTVFEIGGQDSKYIRLKNGVVCDFEMNKVCAAGTGSFLEEQAERVGINIKEEFGNYALNSKSPLQLGERCTVFMEASLVNHQQRGALKEDIVAGLSYSIVQNYLNRVVGDKRVGENIFFQGAVASNKGVVAAFEKVTGKRITVPPDNDVTGAIGVAIIAMEYVKKNKIQKSNFKGFELSKKKYDISTFECKGCANMCDIKKVEVEGEKPLYYGSRCGKYEIAREKKKKEILPDLFAERDELLLKFYKEKSGVPQTRPRIGIPRVLVFYELMPLWVTFFKEMGFEVVLSDATNKTIIHNGVESVISEHCFPIKVAHGHILNLMEKGCRYIFLPTLINMESEYHGIERSFACPFVQALPDVIRAALFPTVGNTEIISPVIYLRRGRKLLKKTMQKVMSKKFTITASEINKALDKAFAAQKEFLSLIKKRGRELLHALKEKAIVIVGRPYNTCDVGLNIEIPKKLMDLGILAIPMDYLELENVELEEEWPNMYWKYGQRIMAALRIIKMHPKLYPLYITNFGCGPDSFILKYFGKEMGRKPYLSIEVDEHSAGAGVITRCEAFLDSLENIGEIVEPGLPWQGSISYSPKKSDLRERIIYVPFMGNHSYIISAAFRACGIDSQVIPISDSKSIELGRQHTSGKECYPCILTTGDMVKITKSPDFNRSSSAFFMPSSSGPCRFGQYCRWQRIVLDELGYADVPILAPNQSSNFYKTLASYGNDFDRRAWFGICAMDILDKLLRETRPYETSKGQTNKVYEECLRRVEKAVEDGGIYNYRKIMIEIKEKFKTISVDKKELKPVIGIVGEIYVRSNCFANDYIVDAVEKLGGEAWVSPIAEWFYYTNLRRAEDELLAGSYLTFVKEKVKNLWQRYKEQDIEKMFRDCLRNCEEPDIKDVLEYSDPYLSCKVEGEAVLSVGKAVDYIKKGASGIVNVMPFTCMPGTNVSAVMTRVKKDFNNIPILNMSYDGLGQTTARTRLEAFMFQSTQFAKNKKKVSGLDK